MPKTIATRAFLAVAGATAAEELTDAVEAGECCVVRYDDRVGSLVLHQFIQVAGREGLQVMVQHTFCRHAQAPSVDGGVYRRARSIGEALRRAKRLRTTTRCGEHSEATCAA